MFSIALQKTRLCNIIEKSKNVYTSHQFYKKLYSTRPGESGLSPFQLYKYKKLFGVTLASITICGVFYLRRCKAERTQRILEDCVVVPLDPDHYEQNTTLYRYKGYVFPGQIVHSGVLQELPHFTFRDSDVLVASFPKTGTTWVQEIVYMLTHDCKATDGSDDNLETRFPYLEYPYPGIKSVSSRTGQRCIKTHLPYQLLPPSVDQCGAKVIYISRNPRDTAVSYYHFVKLLTVAGFKGTFGDFIHNFLNDKVPYSPFMDHVRSYWDLSERGSYDSDHFYSSRGVGSPVLFITYEELSRDPAEVVKKIARHLSIDISEEDIQYVVYKTSFKSMSSNPSVNYEHWKDIGFAHANKGKFLRKGVVGDWQQHLSKDEVTKFEKWEKKNIRPEDCKFEYTLK